MRSPDMHHSPADHAPTPLHPCELQGARARPAAWKRPLHARCMLGVVVPGDPARRQPACSLHEAAAGAGPRGTTRGGVPRADSAAALAGPCAVFLPRPPTPPAGLPTCPPRSAPRRRRRPGTPSERREERGPGQLRR